MRTASVIASPPSYDVHADQQRPRVALWLPPSSERPDSLEVAAFMDAMEFIDHLVELPRSSWLMVGHRLIDDRAALGMRQAARMDVDGAIVDHDPAALAWHVRDALETAAWYAIQGIGAAPRDARREFAATHGAAESTALALLTRPYLPPGTLGTLYAPFDGAINSGGRWPADTDAEPVWSSARPPARGLAPASMTRE